MSSSDLTTKPFDVPAVVQSPPLALATYRPEAFRGLPVRYNEWDKLKRLIRRLGVADNNWWKEAAVLFLGTGLGLSLSVAIPELSGTTPTNTMATLIVTAFAFVVGAVCLLAYRSTNNRDRGSADTIVELMDEIEAQFTRHQ